MNGVEVIDEGRIPIVATQIPFLMVSMLGSLALVGVGLGKMSAGVLKAGCLCTPVVAEHSHNPPVLSDRGGATSLGPTSHLALPAEN